MDDKLIAELRALAEKRRRVAESFKGAQGFGVPLAATAKAEAELLTRALQALEGAWQPISEAPRDGTKIDVWSRDARYTDVFWSDIQEWWCIEGDYGPEEPTPLHVAPAITHFKSLPDPPRDEPIDGENSREAKPILPNPIEGRGP